MMKKIEHILLTIKFFLFSMFMVSLVMSCLIGWVVYKLIVKMPDNNAKSVQVEEMKRLTTEVQGAFGECLSGEDWTKMVRGEGKVKLEQCLTNARGTQAYMRLKAVYEVEVLPVIE